MGVINNKYDVLKQGSPMNLVVSAPSFSNRLASIYSQTKAIDKTLKWGSSFANLTANLLSYGTTSLSRVATQAITTLGKTFSSVRNGIKIFDIFQDLSVPKSDDIHDLRMKWVQTCCFAGADAFNPIFFFENQGVYTLTSKVKTFMGNLAAGLGFVGVATSFVSTLYQRKKDIENLDKIQNAIGTTPITNDIQINPNAQILNAGKEALEEKLFKNDLTLIEKVADIAAIILGLLAGSISSSLIIPAVALLGVISASMALIKMWRESANSQNANSLISEALKVAC
jgi:hypothetical protein